MGSEAKVQLVQSFFVAPSAQTPREGLWLSPLDVAMANTGHTPTVYFYNPAAVPTADFFDVGRLKDAMAKALVAFYPLAGRIGLNVDGRTEIDCNAEGALFVVAESELTVDDFTNVKPSPELRRLFVPRVEPPSVILAVQVTFLACGGVAFGTALHHSAIDALSAFHFFETWSALCRGGAAAAVEMPCHDRTLLRARSPPAVHPDALSVFCPGQELREPSPPAACEVFPISHGQLASIKQACGGASTFATVSAHVWRCAILARRVPPEATARLAFSANIRRACAAFLPSRYFGNAFLWLSASGAARDITSETVASVAGRVKGAVGRMDEELVRSAMDFLELDIGQKKKYVGSLPEHELHIVSWLGMPTYDADFGWGKARAMCRAESVRGGYVYLMNGIGGGPEDQGSAVRVVVSLEAANMAEFQRLLYTKF